MDPLSGDVQGYAPSHPQDPAAPASPMEAAAPDLKPGALPAAPQAQAAGAGTPSSDAAPASAADPGEDAPLPPTTDRAPASEQDAPDNPFAPQAAPPPVDENGDAPDNPFAPSPPAPADQAPLAKSVQTNLVARDAGKVINPHTGLGQPIAPQDFLHDLAHGIAAGFQGSITGLAYNRRTPDQILPEHAPLAMAIGSSLSQFAGDLPVMLPAMLAGGVVGGSEAAAAGTAVAGPVGTVAGALGGGAVGGAAAAGFAPGFVRKGLMEYYEKNGFSSDKRSFTASLMAASWEGIKGAAAMVTGAKVAGAVAPAVYRAAAPVIGEVAAPITANITSKMAELGTMTSVGAGLEGRLPERNDFISGATLMVGLHGLQHITGVGAVKNGPTDHEVATGKLQNTFAATGETPAEISQAAEADVDLRQKLIAGNRMEPEAAQPNKLLHELVHEEPTEEGGERKVVGAQQAIVPNEDAIPPGVGDNKKLVGAPALEGKEYSPEVLKTLAQLGEHESEPGVFSSIGDKVKALDIPGAISAAKTKLGDSWDHFYANNVDYIDPLHMAMEDVAGQGINVDKEMDPESQARVFAAHMDTVRSVFEYGTIDGKTGEVNGEGLNSIFRAMPENGDPREYTALMMAKRGLELHERGITVHGDFNPETAQAVVDQLGEKYEGIEARRQAFNERMIDYGTAKGLWSAETAELIKEKNKAYSPMARAQAFDDFEGAPSGTGSNPMKQIYGSTSDILDPIMQTYKNTQAIIKAAKINEVRQGTVNFLRQANLIEDAAQAKQYEVASPDGVPRTVDAGAGIDGQQKPWLREVKKPVEPITIKGEEITRFLAKQGLDTSVSSDVLARQLSAQGLDLDPSSSFFDKAKVGADPKDALIFRPRYAPLADNEFAVRINGERQVFTGDPDLISTMRRLDGDATAMTTSMRIAKAFADLARFGTVGNPVTGTAFAVAHGIRAQTMAWVNSRSTNFLPFHSVFSLADFMGEGSDMYKEWVRNGGMAGSYDQLNERYLANNGVYGDPKYSGYLGRPWNMLSKVWNAPHAMIQLSDNLSRFTEYRLSREQGVGPLESAQRSRDVVPDYQQVGMQRSVLRTAIAFMGAHINSLDNLADQIKTNTGAVAMRLGVMAFMSAGLYAVNRDDTAIQSAPDWMKDTNWLINLSRFSPGYQVGRDDQQATILRIPKPWSAGIGVASGVEHALGAYFGDNETHPYAFHNFAHSLMASVVPETIPTLAQPVLDQFSNRNAFTGRPLVPEYKQKMLPEMQYSPYTSETSKALAKIIGYVPYVRDLGPSTDPLNSPAVVENYIKTWGGSLGSYALKLSDNIGKGAAAASRGDNPVTATFGNKKADPWENTLFLSRFTSHFPNFSDQNVADFYNNKDIADKAYNSAKALDKAGDYAGAEALRNAHPEYQVRLNQIAKGISTARQAYDKIQESDMPLAQKSQQLNSLLFQIGSMAKTGNQMMQQVQSQTAKR